MKLTDAQFDALSTLAEYGPKQLVEVHGPRGTSEPPPVVQTSTLALALEAAGRRIASAAKWDARFLDLARTVAAWSRDPSTQVGAVIVRPDRTVASLGYNGLPRGVADRRDRLEDRDSKLLMTVHAELNALLTAREPVHGCTVYVWPLPPCSHCAAALIQAGVAEVVSPEPPTDAAERWRASFVAAKTMFAEARVRVRTVPATP